jgi:hypothetical protein
MKKNEAKTTDVNGGEENEAQLKVISLRPDGLLRANFKMVLDAIGYRHKSELARRAMNYGLQKAADEIAEENLTAHREAVKRLRGGISLKPAQLCGCGEGWSSPFLLPVG